MRSVVYSAGFVAEADAIAAHIESLFGIGRADLFRDDLERFCEALADTPGRGKTDHGYRTPLLGVVLDRNWIFCRLNDEAAHFIHIVPSRRLRTEIRF
jgi:plasmid stabilization system protein ParE